MTSIKEGIDFDEYLKEKQKSWNLQQWIHWYWSLYIFLPFQAFIYRIFKRII